MDSKRLLRDRAVLLLTQLQEDTGDTPHRVAKTVGIDPSLAAKVLSGERMTLGTVTTDAIVKKFGLRPEWFTDAHVTRYTDYRATSTTKDDARSVVEEFVASEPRCTSEDAALLRKMDWSALVRGTGFEVPIGLVRSAWLELALTRAGRPTGAQTAEVHAPANLVRLDSAKVRR